nr:MAG TPA: hypothetical protein [Caudoviricetes sp.]
MHTPRRQPWEQAMRLHTEVERIEQMLRWQQYQEKREKKTRRTTSY